ncbi:hypothetical protein [Streptomyces sp. NRRL B-24484]|uniref:hypothetical protein n=1 Tax=Streptomyces sp. NRRL B-24484 TaxID=1463833 RepID=UPI000693EE4D|nr:hypothetical protein [Streptomyces sp. NRRL B-24484]
MGEIVTAVVAVVGTLLGAGLTSFRQFRPADRTERNGRDGYTWSQWVEAYSGFAAAMAELSRARSNRWHRRLDHPDRDPEPARPSSSSAGRPPGRRSSASCSSRAATG